MLPCRFFGHLQDLQLAVDPVRSSFLYRPASDLASLSFNYTNVLSQAVTGSLQEAEITTAKALMTTLLVSRDPAPQDFALHTSTATWNSRSNFLDGLGGGYLQQQLHKQQLRQCGKWGQHETGQKDCGDGRGCRAWVGVTDPSPKCIWVRLLRWDTLWRRPAAGHL
ncbi:MAG: hypothetical protein FRX49_09899 [Trebouxia sp. A1-2]|nr:MAG: hypothetical protein FRX49_09899 [Trebouxia sp. A1-2]